MHTVCHQIHFSADKTQTVMIFHVFIEHTHETAKVKTMQVSETVLLIAG